ncbi:MAG: ARMT1-like domain-containing protein [Thermodesulfobacteriota bacterium]
MAPNKGNSKKTAAADMPISFQSRKRPEADAWFKAFMIENHLDYYGYPDMVASPEQTRFMVFLGDEDRYYPCSDEMFDAIMGQKKPALLLDAYKAALEKILALVDEKIKYKKEKKFLTALIKIKFRHETRDHIMIPSRLEKRLLRIFMTHTQIDDPFREDKFTRNRRMSTALRSDAFNQAINRLTEPGFFYDEFSLTQIRDKINALELKRLLSLCAAGNLWESDAAESFLQDDYQRIFTQPLKGNGVDPFLNFIGITSRPHPAPASKRQRILWLADESGEVVLDIAIIRNLVKLGHKIIIAFKDGALFTKVSFKDAHECDILKKELSGAYFISDKELSKNELVKILRSDHDIYVLSDGTMEQLNLLLTSTTFARVFKEVDGVVSRGPSQYRRLFDTRFQFTQNIFNISKSGDGAVTIAYKPRHSSAIKFYHTDLESKAENIIKQMSSAKKRGMTVIFYSAIIGSIPGKISMAKKIIAAFIGYLTTQLDMTFIINPSEHYEPGMDADDLMYMWEIVQRSGLIDIWRFQTYEDIVQAFQVMNIKVPPEWVGKDATYSTGCTKEMKIALEVQQQYPEMQIIGPAKEKFMRRNEYAIGKMFDIRLSDSRRL